MWIFIVRTTLINGHSLQMSCFLLTTFLIRTQTCPALTYFEKKIFFSAEGNRKLVFIKLCGGVLVPQNLTHLSHSCVSPQIVFCLNRTYIFYFSSYSLVESLGCNKILCKSFKNIYVRTSPRQKVYYLIPQSHKWLWIG